MIICTNILLRTVGDSQSFMQTTLEILHKHPPKKHSRFLERIQAWELNHLSVLHIPSEFLMAVALNTMFLLGTINEAAVT